MVIKRLFDIIGSFLGLVLLSPILFILVILIRVRMNRPVLFCQKRIGRHGIPFIIVKFRTMTLKHAGSTLSVIGESRITPLGAFLRKYKLDELPELWNVLKGDMSFVGPRPDVPEFINRLEEDDRCILNIRPGLTSLASLKYADEEKLLSTVTEPQKYYDEVIWPDKVRLNVKYYRNMSFFGDFMIIFRTLFRRYA